ncbi:MAG: hypothetical protein KGJ11_08820, partial [Candidatus Omnitrophica bacterium]|nr:hypothetical protein [Candidatus Omnitrophota bacterium]
IESGRLIKYFLAGLTVPDKDLWVNLSPYEKDRIIPSGFGLTEMGRDLLAEDYLLKQITASLIYPEGKIGKEFWKKVYAKASAQYGTTDIPVKTFNKVWIVPDKAVVYENAQAGTAYVVQARLKVMLDQDYLSMHKHYAEGLAVSRSTEGVNQLGSLVLRHIVIPELDKEVNEGKNFMRLRQVYNSLILAQWYKQKIRDSILEKIYEDKNKTDGIRYGVSVVPRGAGTHFQNDIEGLYQAYLKAFKKGVYNYIKEEVDPSSREVIPRKYFSGGVNLSLNGRTDLNASLKIVDSRTASPAMIAGLFKRSLGLMMVAAVLSIGAPASAQVPVTNSLQVHRLLDSISSASSGKEEKLNAAQQLGVVVLQSMGEKTNINTPLEVSAKEIFPILLKTLREHADLTLQTDYGPLNAGFIADHLEKSPPEVTPKSFALMISTIDKLNNYYTGLVDAFISRLNQAKPTDPYVIEDLSRVLESDVHGKPFNITDPVSILRNLQNGLKDKFDIKIDDQRNKVIITILEGQNKGRQTILSLEQLKEVRNRSDPKVELSLLLIGLAGLVHLGDILKDRKNIRDLKKNARLPAKALQVAFTEEQKDTLAQINRQLLRGAEIIQRFKAQWMSPSTLWLQAPVQERETWLVDAQGVSDDLANLIKFAKRSKLISKEQKDRMTASLQELKDALDDLWHPIDNLRIDRYLRSKGKHVENEYVTNPQKIDEFQAVMVNSKKTAKRIIADNSPQALASFYGKVSTVSEEISQWLGHAATAQRRGYGLRDMSFNAWKDDRQQFQERLNAEYKVYEGFLRESIPFVQEARLKGGRYASVYNSQLADKLQEGYVLLKTKTDEFNKTEIIPSLKRTAYIIARTIMDSGRLVSLFFKPSQMERESSFLSGLAPVGRDQA